MLGWADRPSIAGKFPTPISNAEDLSVKLTEIRSTIKFQLKKVLCLGVAVGHVQMTDDQVLANVMLSKCRVVVHLLVTLTVKPLRRHQFPCFSPEEKLAKCQVFTCQDNDGQACSTLLNMYWQTRWVYIVYEFRGRRDAQHEAPHA